LEVLQSPPRDARGSEVTIITKVKGTRCDRVSGDLWTSGATRERGREQRKWQKETKNGVLHPVAEKS